MILRKNRVVFFDLFAIEEAFTTDRATATLRLDEYRAPL